MFVKKVSLIIGILLMFSAFTGALVCLMLPSLTNNRVSFDEAILGLIPAVLVFFIGFIITAVAAILMIKARKVT